MNVLEQLKKQSNVVADSGDFESIKKFKPLDSTTNPSLIYAAAKDIKYAYLLDGAIAYAKHRSLDKREQIRLAFEKLLIDFGVEILKVVPGRVSIEVDARLSFDVEASVNKARELIALFEKEGVGRERILIKLAATWEGISAAKILTGDHIRCNLTLLFSLPQAIACAQAGVQLISPFVGRVLDWYKREYPEMHYLPNEEPGVLLVKTIFNYYKKFGYETEIMCASFRNSDEILELSGCDLMTISPALLLELEEMVGKLDRHLTPTEAVHADIKKMDLDEKSFRWLLNQDAMASEKLAEGIRRFAVDCVKLEELLSLRLG